MKRNRHICWHILRSMQMSCPLNFYYRFKIESFDVSFWRKNCLFYIFGSNWPFLTSKAIAFEFYLFTERMIFFPSWNMISFPSFDSNFYWFFDPFCKIITKSTIDSNKWRRFDSVLCKICMVLKCIQYRWNGNKIILWKYDIYAFSPIDHILLVKLLNIYVRDKRNDTRTINKKH